MSLLPLTESEFREHCALTVAASAEFTKQGEDRLVEIMARLNDGKTPVAVAVLVLEAALKFYYLGAVQTLKENEAEANGQGVESTAGRAVN